ncbi:nucleoside phosphorylase domain-containing protein [Aspergillus caelatus]|uniref:Nucleoside phosphorylase domain-containing protein n=1 Tax=Aspergillus caelatus TaxID=61420 RepID=A0A5N7ACX4_9EURO|nr:nucleoside phosphorylase domain-containing protein [Aspergillus caelatus]KAE8367523.1 nucleoside phosphorylase domain-containing protein [Aspergillus caelatus]
MVESTPRPSNNEFTIGWVCALLKEYIAAREILDEIYDERNGFLRAEDGANYYTRGRVGPHKVVIGCLPAGKYGLVSTSGVAEDMKRRFLSIRLVFMVGIGGGVPNATTDVRLGDVVIGTRVVQYGFGKRTPDGFKITGETFSPAPEFRPSIDALRRRLSIGTDLHANLEATFDKSQPTRDTFRRPAAHTDRLYAPEYVHTRDCECTGEQAEWHLHLIQRPPRRNRLIEVHEGTIASADQVMKDAKTRDQLAHELEAICFEMEAAGLSDTFNWIAIRGICDYADAHKNDQWHGYAAAAAAVCAKELLLTIPPVNPTGMERVSEHKRWEVDRADFMRVLEKLPTGIVTTMHSALIGTCVLLAIFGQLIWSFYLWMLSVAANIHSPDFNPPMKAAQPMEGPTQQFGGAPIHINIHVAQQAVSHARRQSEVDWIESPHQCPTEFSTVQWNGAEREKVLGSTAELLQGVRTLMGKEISRNISISIPHDTGGPLSPVDSSCDPFDRVPWQRQDASNERSDSVSSASKPPVPPRSKKPRGYVSRRNTQIPVPNSIARRNKQSAEHKSNKSQEAGEEVPEIVALINEFRGRASISAYGNVHVRGQEFFGQFVVDGLSIAAPSATLQYESLEDLNGDYEIDTGSSSVGPNDVKIAAHNSGGKTVSLSGEIMPPAPSGQGVAGVIRFSIRRY